MNLGLMRLRLKCAFLTISTGRYWINLAFGWLFCYCKSPDLITRIWICTVQFNIDSTTRCSICGTGSCIRKRLMATVTATGWLFAPWLSVTWNSNESWPASPVLGVYLLTISTRFRNNLAFGWLFCYIKEGDFVTLIWSVTRLTEH